MDFSPGFKDFSTPKDTNKSNQNNIYYGAVNIDRSYFTLNEASSDIPAQLSRKLYNPKIPVKFCYNCPVNSTLPELKHPYKDWKSETDKLIGNTGLNKNNGEYSFLNNDSIYQNWKTYNNSFHEKNGCYTID